MTRKAFLLWVFLALALAGCVSSKEDDIRDWMARERNQAKPRAAPIHAPKQFIPQPYIANADVEPFSSQKMTQAFKRDAALPNSNGALVASELARRKEPLESFALEGMSMVGSISKAGQPVALVKADGRLYPVRLGNHMGQNFGRVTKITETELTLREIAQDAVGEWIERITTLRLQEKSL